MLVPKAWSLGPVFTVANSALQGGWATPRDQLYRAGPDPAVQGLRIGPGSARQGLRDKGSRPSCTISTGYLPLVNNSQFKSFH